MKTKHILPIILLSTIITDVFRYVSYSGYKLFESATYIAAGLSYLSIFLILMIFIRNKKDKSIPQIITVTFTLWLGWNFINVFRSLFIANSYWDWKFLLLHSVLFSLVSVTFYLGQRLNNFVFISKFYVKIIFLFGLLLIPISFVTNQELYSRLMIPVTFLILLIPYFRTQWKFMILLVAVTSIIVVLGFRVNIIKIAIALFILVIYYFNLKRSILRIVNITLFSIPIVLLLLGIFSNFNVFEELSKKEILLNNKETGKVENLTSDSRSFLYIEVFDSFNNTSQLLFGKSLVGTYDSYWFYDTGGAFEGKRYKTEVNFLNLILHQGLVGVLIYMVLLFYISTIAIMKSNNQLAKMLGILITTRWILSFVEEFNQFDINFFFFWLVIGLLSNPKFRGMSDDELKACFQ